MLCLRIGSKRVRRNIIYVFCRFEWEKFTVHGLKEESTNSCTNIIITVPWCRYALSLSYFIRRTLVVKINCHLEFALLAVRACMHFYQRNFLVLCWFCLCRRRRRRRLLYFLRSFVQEYCSKLHQIAQCVCECSHTKSLQICGIICFASSDGWPFLHCNTVYRSTLNSDVLQKQKKIVHFLLLHRVSFHTFDVTY